jgi:DNA-binding NarL/FixJ family response regulator
MNKIKVIICEDHSLFREGIKAYLNAREDITCVGEAENGAQLLHMLRHIDAEKYPDIVLLDINMPIMAGEETLEILKAEHSNLKVIMLTMHNQVSMVEKMMSLGANSYVPKTEASDQIVKAILSVYDSNYYFNDLINQALVQSVRKKKIIEQDNKIQDTPEVAIDEIEIEEPEKKLEKHYWVKKILMGALYGFIFAAVTGLIIYLITKVASNLADIENIQIIR